MSILLVLAGYFSYAVSKLVFILCALPVALVLMPFPAARRKVLQGMLHRFLGFFTRSWLPLLGVYRLSGISGLENAALTSSAVIVANHRGFMDGLFILGLVPRTGVVIKAVDTRQPTYALLERHFDVVAVDRNSLDSVSMSLERCRAVLRNGSNLLIFPEGTRARSGRLQRFTRTAFQLALAAKAPVLPVVVHSTHPFMAKVPGSIFPRGRNSFRLEFLSPEPLQAGDNAEKLGDRVHRRMAQVLRRLDAGTYWEVNSLPGGEYPTPASGSQNALASSLSPKTEPAS